MKPGAILLLLAVAASQVDLNVADSLTNIANTGPLNISDCPISFYGKMYSLMDVKIEGAVVVVCFQNDPAEVSGDCMTAGGGPIDLVGYFPGATGPSDKAAIQSELPDLVTSSGCRHFLVVYDGSSLQLNLKLYKFESLTALTVRPMSYDVTLNTTVNFTAMASRVFAGLSPPTTYFMDLNGCRLPGVTLKANSEMLTPNCSKIMCDGAAVASSGSACGPGDICQDDNTCFATPEVCTVTGSTVIDFAGRVHSIPDRCTYTLIDNPSLMVLVTFMERRRKDVPFLSYIFIMNKKSFEILILETGGHVLDTENEQVAKLNASTQVIQGVELSKDHTGVTAKLPLSNMTLFFDGTTAHISGAAEHLTGLCGNPTNSSQTTTPSEAKPLFFDTKECEIQHTDAVDATINCNRSTDYCNLMRQAPFTACHAHVDPEPYITACTNTLCNYPTVDGLNCQLLEAYAKACYLRSRVTLGDWRSTAGCPAVPQDLCQDRYCSHHEFCGVILGEAGCLCRALFAEKYKPTNSLGDSTVCRQNSATISLAGCLLKEKSIDYSLLHLNDPSCTGHMDENTHMLTFSFDSTNKCGTEVMTNNSKLIYKNTITVRNGTFSGVITRHDQVEIDFSCYYQMPDVRSVSFRIKDSSVVQKIVSGIWNYTLIMTAYTDRGLSHLVKPTTEVQLNQKIWLKLDAEELDDSLVAIVTDSCWATSLPSPDSAPRYNLIINKCPNPADHTVRIEGNGQGTSNVLSFNMFEFSGQSSEIYLHCQVELCPTGGPTCAPNCGGGVSRRRRSFRSRREAPSALITMAWSN